MPIKWILHWQPSPGTTVNAQILSKVSQCAESINDVKEGRWKNTLSFYKAMVREQTIGKEFPHDFVGISLAEQPGKYFLVIRGKRLVVEAESSIQMIMEKLQSYKTRVVALNFEGNQYQLGDFQLRVGKVVPMHLENLRGIVMEMEYVPISSWEKSHHIMGEYFDLWQDALAKRSLPGHCVHIESSFAEYGLSDHYGMQHTSIQYANITTQIVATSQSLQAPETKSLIFKFSSIPTAPHLCSNLIDRHLCINLDRRMFQILVPNCNNSDKKTIKQSSTQSTTIV